MEIKRMNKAKRSSFGYFFNEKFTSIRRKSELNAREDNP